MLKRFSIEDLPASPWKNGGGSTREIVCRPPSAGMDGFDWRVSIATIAQTGPFSAFPGVDRVIMLLEGDGVHLHSSCGIDHRLDQKHEPFYFHGEVALECTLVGGTSTDFNVMTRRCTLRADVKVLRGARSIPVSPQGLLLALRGKWQLHDDDTKQTCLAGQGLWWDAVPLAWQISPLEDCAALVWVSLDMAGV